ncbi:integrin alpha-PS2 isoform X2 [Drosophila bipectinata]|uniref:integrin alpha-PS2 isoform X2 n=1 Tax=Drosophila bipectinata TaxID=42026 RepID=UPI001C8A2A8F|nr:integrin alpha-PS2 isoform X2 [Drosophila bipectinata]
MQNRQNRLQRNPKSPNKDSSKNCESPSKTRKVEGQEHTKMCTDLPRLRMGMSWLVILLAIAVATDAYNIDLPSYVRFRQAANSMFGFSIAMHKSRSNFYSNQNNCSLIVGAPKLDTSRYQPGVSEAGAVFKCSLNDDDCKLVKFDSKGNIRNSDHEIVDRKSNQWLGATVATGRDSDLVVACAPRYVYHTMTPSKAFRIDPVGTCFTTHDFENFNEVSPCRTNNWGYHRQGSCQAGFSAAINGNGSRLYIGAPGSWYWQGQASSHDVTRPENQVFSTGESPSANDDSYLGYSMVTGDFDGDRNEDVAIGMPRGANLVGKIVVNSWNMSNIFNITGRQIGEYFGYSLATSDVDGDGLDDLIIGAPLFTDPDNVEGKYDVGRVYILLQGGPNFQKRWYIEHIRDGYQSKGRFGLALTTLGDVNGDGYGDFAVGAPYDGPEGRGVVYIFHGSPLGPLAKPSQVIKSEQLVEGAPYPRTFGFALSGGVDMDGNTYPDLAVGAYSSDQVFIFKARPVAAVDASTSFASSSKLISLDDRSCQLQRDHKQVPCMLLTTCWSYTGRFLPGQLDFDVSWLLDAKKLPNPRLFFLRDEGKNIRNQTIRLNYNQKYCLNETVYLMDKVQDKLTPLTVEARYNLLSQRNLNPVVRTRRQALEPVIDQNRDIVLTDAINIQKNCGPDNICEPDLKLEVKTVDKYLFGSPEPLVIEVLISNNNEDAFEAAFYMITPPDLQFRKLQQLGEKKDAPITCSPPTPENNHTLKCDIGNPLESGKIVNFKISLVPEEKYGTSSSYDFYWEANSTNLEKVGSDYDNKIRQSVGIWVDTDLDIKGTSLPPYQLYKADEYNSLENATKEEEIGPQVVHIYEIRNNRPSIIEEAEVFIHLPYQTIVGDPLMYLLNQPETGGRIRCDEVVANENNLVLDEKLRRKSYLQAQGAIFNSAEAAGQTGAAAAGGGLSGDEGHLQVSQGGGGSGQSVLLSNRTEPQNRLTPKQVAELEREDQMEVPGDASFVHRDRANQAQAQAQEEPRVNHSSYTTWSTSTSTAPGSGAGASAAGHSTQGHIHMAGPTIQQNFDYRYPQQQQIVLAGAGSGGQGGSYQDKSQFGGRPGNFHAGTLDLGTLNRGNVDNELYRSQGVQYPSQNLGQFQTQSQGHINVQPPRQYQSQNYQQQYGTPGAPGGYHHVSYSSGSKPYYGLENENFYDENNLQRSPGQWSSSSSSSQRRFKRSPDEDQGQEPQQIDLNSPCKAARCQTIRCVVSNLGTDDGDAAFVAIRARMVAKTMEKLASNVPLNVSTLAVANITKLPFIGAPKDAIIKSHEIFYKAEPEPQPVPDVVPLWVVVLAACAGALIFLLLVLLLYKCGFFNRNRPTDHSQERQPLRNGYHGDEHL